MRNAVVILLPILAGCQFSENRYLTPVTADELVGTWRATEFGNVGHQALQFDVTPAPSVGPPHFYFAEEGGRLLLWQYVTDPDAWRYMEFEKTGA